MDANNKQPIIANHYFSYVSSECQLLFESGYYYGCIALCQSLAEAYARFLYERWIGEEDPKTFGARINKLQVAGIQPDVSKLLSDMYGGQQRQDFHHLNKAVPPGYQQLKVIATEKINLLNKVESQVFEYRYTDGGGIKVKYEIYWDKKDSSHLSSYLRLESA